jgi:hypothetical protein
MAEDARNTAAEGNQLVTPERSVDAAPVAVASAKAREVLLPQFNIWLPLQRMRDAVVRRLV